MTVTGAVAVVVGGAGRRGARWPCDRGEVALGAAVLPHVRVPAPEEGEGTEQGDEDDGDHHRGRRRPGSVVHRLDRVPLRPVDPVDRGTLGWDPPRVLVHRTVGGG